ncbi:hypothetical protein [Natrarchaeobaculum sulfurireducens]|uniref:Terminase small subunit n=1 Tax=Natrarchaeobaculum sulfurireducens TaxID=2044521 RepID=A0A346PHK3_9EURY|nr:hypothetical protein [Natrarchaeobaculum sulfurireducens]AXR78998.1 Terminase small subunit [Natrarchaeobaculum sulfurireducens]
MNVDEDELVGQPSDEVPTLEPTDEHCRGKRTERRDGETVFVAYCRSTPGRGTDHVGEGRCKHHGGNAGSGGARAGAGAPAGNTNGTTHGGYTDEKSFYADVLDESLQALADEIFEDYLEEYERRHGREPPKGLEMELERLSISHVKDVVLDQWANDKPESLESGNPLVDRETERDFNPEDGSVTVETYKESVVIQAQRKLSSDRRQWLKDLGLLDDPESQKADAMQDSLELTLSSEDKEALEEAFDEEPDT